MFTIETLTVTGQWYTVDPLTGSYYTFPTLAEAQAHAREAEAITGQPTRAREV